MDWKLLVLLLAFFSSALTHAADPAGDERIYLSYKRTLEGDAHLRLVPGFTSDRYLSLALDAIEDVLASGKELDLRSILPFGSWRGLPPKEQARWFRLGGIADEADLVDSLSHADATPGLLYELLHQKWKSPAGRGLVFRMGSELPESAKIYENATAPFTPPSGAEVRALYSTYPDVPGFQNGAYAGKPRLFLFCRHNRRYSCLFTMRDKDDKPLRYSSGRLWTQPALALSGHNKPFNERSGHTPQGVHLVNGVMPEANDPYSYGRYRRLVLEFPPDSPGESEFMRLLPASSHDSSWWKEASIARDVGRRELRIHGTGQRNEQPSLPYFPFIPTSGCIAQREMEYDSTNFIDQRKMLDALMHAQGLQSGFSSEPSIRALLYVIDLGETNAAVTAADLASYGIQ
ncbi:MAG TPA: hypothetical protein VIH99_08825 [Bdellovibrionota bacterium]|jgi:hypothetical protein